MIIRNLTIFRRFKNSYDDIYPITGYRQATVKKTEEIFKIDVYSFTIYDPMWTSEKFEKIKWAHDTSKKLKNFS